METLSRAGLLSSPNFAELTCPAPLPIRTSPFHRGCALSRKNPRFSVFRNALPGNELAREDALQMFLRERQLNGDFISKATDILWIRGNLESFDSEISIYGEIPQQLEEVIEKENDGGFLKLKKTQEWVLGDNIAPINKKTNTKELQNNSERRKRLNFLKYEALKKELMLLNTAIGAACSGYCLVAFSVQAAISYASGVLFSSLYLQLLYRHADSLSKETVPQIFMLKKSKKIGIRSEDLKNLLERSIKGSTIALSSPRLVIPAAIYGIWGLSQHFSNDLFDFQLVPAMFGMFAYKAAALVQVYRDNEDLRLVFPESEESTNYPLGLSQYNIISWILSDVPQYLAMFVKLVD
ncbi:uncharacterized protein LOC122063878 [Macadamia integrifolia]|uniref:uncharacterized protein LOC122063878 n=1 Tax=Macadamia integrifolia TaxID=60698 RepID=UPI001C4FCA5C|nr:uncharacterized protein LOC122063878 [Macadamia integrifolia]